MSDELVFPMRINRYLAKRGLATRRAADRLIEAGNVLKNGIHAKLGDQVQSTDVVEVVKEEGASLPERIYIAYYKPRGIITHSPQRGERSIDDVSLYADTFPVGRLDKDSEGLIILTNDGRVTDRLLNPLSAHEKEYRVRVREKIEVPVKRILEAGVTEQGERLTAKKVTVLDNRELSIVLTEGKKHQIRRMLSAAHLTVEKLLRIRIMDVHLGALRPGAGRKLTGLSRKRFLADVGLSEGHEKLVV